MRLMELAFINWCDFKGPFLITVSLLDMFLIRRREALYTRLLSVENTRRSKCFLKVVKMWIKEIRF